MIEAIFVSPQNTRDLDKSHANYLIVHEAGLDHESWENLKPLGMELSIALSTFSPENCPADPAVWEKLQEKIQTLLTFDPQALWFDHFRFPGKWEKTLESGQVNGYAYKSAHAPCRYCRSKERSQTITELAKKVRTLVPPSVKTGYFAVPIKESEMPELYRDLGQDHQLLGKYFDQISPMLYHRMVNKPVQYISEYVKYLSTITKIPVLPIIQVKDMPDNLEDKMTEGDIKEAFEEAIKPPSVGVAIFWWNHALEKNKTGIIQKLFSEN